MSRTYKVDLKGYMANCEANYYRLQKLLPNVDKTVDSGESIQLGLPGAHKPILTVTVIERTAYTSLLAIFQNSTITANNAELSRWLASPCLKVRLYHDARLAEVVTCNGVGKPKPKNSYPNETMSQPDEKAQWNQFLADWLKVALRHGFLALPVYDFSR